MELVAGNVELGCSCPGWEKPKLAAPTRWRVNLKQMMLLLTTVAILLSIFRHPIGLMFDEVALRWAAVPWSVYGWLFFGSEIINPKTLPKNPMGILMFMANLAVACLLPMAVGAAAVAKFKDLWQQAHRR